MGCTANIPQKIESKVTDVNKVTKIPNEICQKSNLLLEDELDLNLLLSSKGQDLITQKDDYIVKITSNSLSTKEKILFTFKILKINEKIAKSLSENVNLCEKSKEILERLFTNTNTFLKSLIHIQSEKEVNKLVSRSIGVHSEIYHFLSTISNSLNCFEEKFWWNPLSNGDFVLVKLEELSKIIRQGNEVFIYL